MRLDLSELGIRSPPLPPSCILFTQFSPALQSWGTANTILLQTYIEMKLVNLGRDFVLVL